MASNRLLVPIVVHGIVVHPEDASRDRITWVNRAPAWNRVVGGAARRLRGDQVEDAPFTPTAGPDLPLLRDEHGVHVHWVLPPAAFGDDVVRQPGRLPTRWLVLRTTRLDGRPGPAAAWMVESDFLGPEVREPAVAGGEQDGSPAFPFFDETGDGERRLRVHRIGRRVAVAGWTEDWQRPRLRELSVIGAADPLFATAYTHCRNVLGLHDRELVDDLRGVTADRARIAYSVFGWWDAASAGVDMLSGVAAGDELVGWLADHGLADPGVVERAPTGTLFHGRWTEVPWHAAAAGDVPAVGADGVPAGGDGLRIGVGQTLVEALGALLAETAPGQPDDGLARLWEAIQYRLVERLDEPDGPTAVEQELHEHGFAVQPGDATATVGPIAADPIDPAAARPPAAIPAEVGDWLAARNLVEREMNRAFQLVDEEFRSLAYAAWFLTASALPGGGPDLGGPSPRAADLRAWLLGPFRAWSEAYDAARGTMWSGDPEAMATRLPAALGGGGATPTLEVRTVAGPRWFEPRDPALVLFQRDGSRSPVLDPGRGDDRKLGCRLPGQILGFLRERDLDRVVRMDEWLRPVILALATPDVRPWLTEQIDGALATLQQPDPLALLGDRRFDSQWNLDRLLPLPGEVPDELPALLVECFLLDDLAAGQAEGRLSGRHPDPLLAADATRYAPRFTPLFLEWSAEWRSTYEAPPAGDAAVHFGHALDGWSAGDVDFRYTGVAPGAAFGPSPDGHVLVGRSPVSLLDGRWLAEPLTAFASGLDPAVAAGADELVALAATLRDRPVYFHTLGGLHRQLLQRVEDLQFPVLAPQEVTGDPIPAAERALRDLADRASWGARRESVDPDLPFFPIRAGNLSLRRLWVIDPFGRVQVCDAIDAGTLAVAESLRADPARLAEGPIQLPPRLCFPTRLDFRFGDARVAGFVESNAAPATSPICGWLVPDHLDRSLAVHDAAGALLGELWAIEDGVRWQDAPDRPDPRATNPHLSAVIDALAGFGADFADWLDRVDETMTGVAPAEDRRELGAAALVGRPLAVARARLRLEARGLGPVDLRPDAILAGGEPGYLRVRFPVRLGDPRRAGDGLIGWFGDDEPGRFHLAWAEDADRDRPHVVAGHPIELTLHPSDPGAVLTLILDPRGAVHARTPILPVKAISLDEPWLRGALERLEVGFAVGPLLAAGDPIGLPLPAEHTGAWTWHQPIAPADDDGPAAFAPAVAPRTIDDLPRFEDAASTLRIVEGRLRHAPAEAAQAALPPMPAPPAWLAEFHPPAWPLPLPGLDRIAEGGGGGGPPAVAGDRPSFPFALAFDQDVIEVSADPRGAPQRQRLVLRVDARPQYQLAPRAPAAPTGTDGLYLWFLWEDLDADIEAAGHLDLRGGALEGGSEAELARARAAERRGYPTLCRLGEADGIVAAALPPFDLAWRVTSIHGLEAAGTGHCWLVEPASGDLLGGPEAPCGLALGFADVVCSRPGRAVLVAQAYVAGRHSGFAHAYVTKRAS